uniref:Thioredoxin domain-containing protein n=1 Tax=Fibrocapsa japonica TaxID=94617 RepID=A0A7S2XYZ8_9STRA|eukprot:CAMPEP_0113943450 /NCGR_PEP_ID=MMETSP1339-20121228/24098_1 /TAXON_ID=94617 /ORGANISM="Fibrocapsa japonica" /LENGTH=160 /DNA_ID=CAMNT_0000948321 /DNA_START=26 /DNA_END=508 /DNA_ORIENTATION=- /assembly_acc=CAM_ASM_000762
MKFGLNVAFACIVGLVSLLNCSSKPIEDIPTIANEGQWRMMTKTWEVHLVLVSSMLEEKCADCKAFHEKFTELADAVEGVIASKVLIDKPGGIAMGWKLDLTIENIPAIVLVSQEQDYGIKIWGKNDDFSVEQMKDSISSYLAANEYIPELKKYRKLPAV